MSGWCDVVRSLTRHGREERARALADFEASRKAADAESRMVQRSLAALAAQVAALEAQIALLAMCQQEERASAAALDLLAPALHPDPAAVHLAAVVAAAAV